MSINRQINKKITIDPYNGILCRNKKVQNTDMRNTMEESPKTVNEQKMPDTKHTHCFLSYEMERQAQPRGAGAGGKWLQGGMREPSGVIEMFYILMVVAVTLANT